MTTRDVARVDVVTLEVLRNALPAIADEMSLDLQRTSYNMMIYEVRDYCCALLDPDGGLISQNIGGVSHFVADLGVVIRDGVERFGKDGFAPGDVILMNHQRVAGQHLNNVCVYTPCFFERRLIAFAAVRAHWVDVGGHSTGFSATSLVTDPWTEGMQFDQIKIYEKGVAEEKVLQLIGSNIRYPEASMGDLRSQMAACRLAERRLEELYLRYGRDTIEAALETIFDEAEIKCRRAVSEIPDGTYEAESFLDNDGADKQSVIPLKVRVTVSGSDMTIDLTQCSLQRRGAMNSRTLAAPYIAYKCVTTPLEPVNEGSFRGLNVVIQEGNIMMAQFPAPMASWSRVLPTVVDIIIKALSSALPEKMPAANMGMMGVGVSLYGYDPVRSKKFLMQTIEGGGWGARPWGDGESASVSVCQGDVRNAPVETIELKAPVLIEKRGLREDSGGAGRFRGGLGVDTRIKNLADGNWTINNYGRRLDPPWGLWGGKAAATSETLVQLPGDAEFHHEDPARKPLPAGTRLILRSGGGGGWGHPHERDPERVLFDVIEGLVSMKSASEDYGVVIDPDSRTINHEATSARRARPQNGHPT